MATIVHQTDKRTGITYAYESVSYWDKEKKQSRAKRKLIGKVDPATGNVVPTRKRKAKEAERLKNPGPVPAECVKRSFYGATYLLDQIGEKLGIKEDLKRCFPDRYQQILSVAYYLILEDRSPLSRFPKWAVLHNSYPLKTKISNWMFNFSTIKKYWPNSPHYCMIVLKPLAKARRDAHATRND